MKLIKILILSTSLLIASITQAALITTQETALDSIFSQPSFGNIPIDIRIGTAIEMIFPDLLDITTSAEVSQLFGMHVGSSTVVNFFFVDTIDYCDGFNTGIVGCGEFPGNDFIVESTFAAGAFGGELLAHELGHNLGLDHLSGSYLMNPSLNNSTILTAGEVSTIRSSPLVKSDSTGYWIDINPVLIVAQATTPSPIPEPSSLLLFLLSFGLFFQNRIQKNK